MVDAEYTNIKEIYENELKSIIESKNVKSVLIVGSAKDIDFEVAKDINDIDLFVITEEGFGQTREIKLIKEIEFDINYFPISLADEFVRNNEYFFIQAMKNANLVYDENDLGKLYIQKSLQKYSQGPNELTKSEKSKLSYEIQSTLKRLVDNNSYDRMEYELLSNLCVRDLIKSYFMLNKKWVPKDKKLFSVLKKDNKELYELVNKYYQEHSSIQLEKIYNYVFKNIKIVDYIKMNY